MEKEIKNNIHFCQATLDDILLLQQLAQQIWPVTYREILSPDQIEYMMNWLYSAEALKQQLLEKHIFILMYHNENPAGFADYIAKEEKNIYKLNKIYIALNYQRSGLGKALLNEVIRRVKELHGQILELNVNRYNKAKSFYEKMGFAVYQSVDIPIGNGYYMNDYVMRKSI